MIFVGWLDFGRWGRGFLLYVLLCCMLRVICVVVYVCVFVVCVLCVFVYVYVLVLYVFCVYVLCMDAFCLFAAFPVFLGELVK